MGLDLVGDHGLDLLEELHVDLALAHALSARLAFLVDFLAVALVADWQVLRIEGSLRRQKSAADLLLLADGVLLACLGVGVDLGVARALGDPSFVALGTSLTSPYDGTDASMGSPDAFGVAAEAVLGSLSAVELVNHIFGIGGGH